MLLATPFLAQALALFPVMLGLVVFAARARLVSRSFLLLVVDVFL
jgi:hypothetical protein